MVSLTRKQTPTLFFVAWYFDIFKLGDNLIKFNVTLEDPTLLEAIFVPAFQNVKQSLRVVWHVDFTFLWTCDNSVFLHLACKFLWTCQTIPVLFDFMKVRRQKKWGIRMHPYVYRYIQIFINVHWTRIAGEPVPNRGGTLPPATRTNMRQFLWWT